MAPQNKNTTHNKKITFPLLPLFSLMSILGVENTPGSTPKSTSGSIFFFFKLLSKVNQQTKKL